MASTSIKNQALILLTVVTLSLICNTTLNSQNKIQNKIKGISFIGPHEPTLDISMINAVDEIHANWIAVIPESTLDRSTLLLIPDNENYNWSETQQGVQEIIQLAKQSRKKIMLKPQVVLAPNNTPNEYFNELASYINLNYKVLTDKTYGAKWRGDFVPRNEKDWKIWESTYQKYILEYARLASNFDVDLFCIGTELREFVVRRPEYWKSLIQQIRAIYDGPLTYSANWDEFHKVTFWKELDYIGTNTYHPISEDLTPNKDKVFDSWRKIRSQIRKASQKANRKVIITEYGYRNIAYAGLEPWTHDKGLKKTPNYQAQSNLYEAFFRGLWNESWVAGGFGWNWIYHELPEGNTDFSIQGKPAMQVVAKYYSK